MSYPLDSLCCCSILFFLSFLFSSDTDTDTDTDTNWILDIEFEFGSAATKEEITQGGLTVASLFFRKVFGTQAQRALTVFVALRYVMAF